MWSARKGSAATLAADPRTNDIDLNELRKKILGR